MAQSSCSGFGPASLLGNWKHQQLIFFFGLLFVCFCYIHQKIEAIKSILVLIYVYGNIIYKYYRWQYMNGM